MLLTTHTLIIAPFCLNYELLRNMLDNSRLPCQLYTWSQTRRSESQDDRETTLTPYVMIWSDPRRSTTKKNGVWLWPNVSLTWDELGSGYWSTWNELGSGYWSYVNSCTERNGVWLWPNVSLTWDELRSGYWSTWNELGSGYWSYVNSCTGYTVNSYPKSTRTKSTRTHGQLVPKSTCTQGQLVPKCKRNAK